MTVTLTIATVSQKSAIDFTGYVKTHLRRGGIFNSDFITNLLQNVTVKAISKTMCI